MPASYSVNLSDVEADSGGVTEAGITQRDVVREGMVQIGGMAIEIGYGIDNVKPAKAKDEKAVTELQCRGGFFAEFTYKVNRHLD